MKTCVYYWHTRVDMIGWLSDDCGSAWSLNGYTIYLQEVLSRKELH